MIYLFVGNMFYIYKITNNVNGKIYIGQTQNLERRWKAHIRISRTPNSKNFYLLHKAISKYGKENFIFKELESYQNYNDVLIAEINWISYYTCNVSQYGYNLTAGGEGHTGHKHSLETKEKLRQKAIGRKAAQSTKDLMSEHRTGSNNSMFGKSHTETSKKKMGDSKKILKLTQGERNGKSKLTEQQVREIKLLLKEGKLQQKEIAIIYNVWASTIQKIASGKNWAYII